MGRQNDYVVVMPDAGVNVGGYSEIPREGVVKAVSYRQAVRNHVHINNPNITGIVMTALDKMNIRLEDRAILIPEVDLVNQADGTRLDGEDVKTFRAMALAQEMAHPDKDPRNYLRRAVRYVDMVYNN